MLATANSTSAVVPVLTPGEGLALLIVLAVGLLVAGLVVIWGRTLLKDKKGQTDTSLVRSWVAVALVFGLLAFCGVAFLMNDSSVRSTLVGGLVASAGTAIAFYFASKSSDQARSDLLQAATTLGQNALKPTDFVHCSPPDGPTGNTYQYTFVANGSPTPTYWLASGSAPLPTGLTLDTNGSLNGTPTTAGAYTFAVAAVNSAGVLKTPDLTVTIS